MNSKIWTGIVSLVLLISLLSFLVVFQENQVEPRIAGIPFIFWTGFLITALLVGLTFLASRFFPHQDEPGK